ncbi:MAG: hypothetical protein KDD60_05845 [Bdellovibrionales bacterium]|nr:hypothetical protein [Bdellovibrionales bacterium]
MRVRTTFPKMSLVIIMLVLACDQLSAAPQVESGYRCKRSPSFLGEYGFSPSNSAFTTSLRKQIGLFLIEARTTPGKERQVYQHPTWRMGGYLGALTFSEQGEIFVLPAPHVNLQDNPPAKSNIVYRVDPKKVAMEQWKVLPSPEGGKEESTFGAMGITYSCFSDSLYVSSVFGSTRTREVGVVYHLNAKTGEVLGKLNGFDGFGLASLKVSGRPFLLLGSARSSDLFGVVLDESGKFLTPPNRLLSLTGLGPRGDDRIKKIVVNEDSGVLEITGYAFHFNLMNPVEEQKSLYRFKLREIDRNGLLKWEFLGEG